MIQGGKVAARRLRRAQILLAADVRSTDEQIARNVSVGTSTVYRPVIHRQGTSGSSSGRRRSPCTLRADDRNASGLVPSGTALCEPMSAIEIRRWDPRASKR
jgi:hypothetical protein